jgi:hypothetical protein
VWVDVDEIDNATYPTLDSYISAGWKPGSAQGWSGFEIVDRGPIRTAEPVQVYEFVAVYRDDEGTPTRLRTHWYLLGKYQVTVDALMDQSVWDAGGTAFTTLNGVQASFKPVNHTAGDLGYSVSHPPSWSKTDAEGFDYKATGPLGGGVWVRIRSSEGYTNAFDFGSAYGGSDWNVTSRTPVYENRPNASYRIDYTRDDEDTGKTTRWALLITLAGDSAFLVWVGGEESEWTNVESVVDGILLRVAVRN